MKLQNIYQADINRDINGVIKVAQNDEHSMEQELREYIITKELRSHFSTFFTNYERSIERPTDKIGVWISGFFGSGKSHFLKMLSYLLSNPVVAGKRAVEYFSDKFDDPMMFTQIENCAKVPTDTILFNIDSKSPINKDKTAILRVFAKVFYEHIGLYGDDLKVAKLEQFLLKNGKKQEFEKKFKEINGDEWVNVRDAFAFWGDDIVETMTSVLGMSRETAISWFDGTETAEISIEQLVKEIKDYIDGKGKNYRLLFMIDEVGQYIGSDSDLMLNLQTIVEEIGTHCEGRVWVMVTSQEAIDSITKISGDDFSKIQGRFNTRLSLSSSSVDEVIKKRILAKNQNAENELRLIYSERSAILKNLFTFHDAVLDLKGYSSETEFTETYPFVPYQFRLMQNVLAQIRKHGNSGKHLSGGERSMLSGFQEAAQKLNEKDENALVPFSLFYDTVHTFLEGAIRRVIDRCQLAADNKDGIEPYDIEVLKLLYLIRYIDDVKSNTENIVTLMIDDMRADKIDMRKKVQESLDRLLSQNYIARNGDHYTFLTDDEQDIERDIRNTFVDSANIIQSISQTLFSDLYLAKKFRYGAKYDFPYDQLVDDVVNGQLSGAIRLHIITDAYDQKNDAVFLMKSAHENEAIVVLSSEYPYYNEFESAMKIRKYVKTKNLSQLPEAIQAIIRGRQQEASSHEKRAKEYLVEAINKAKFFVAGENIIVKQSGVQEKFNYVLSYLVESVYTKLDYVTQNFNDDSDVLKILNAPHLGDVSFANSEAVDEIKQYLDIQIAKMMPVSMGDIQRRFSAIPYGWREVDIACAVAALIADQKIIIQYSGENIMPQDKRLPDFLRRKGEVDKARVQIRESIDAGLLKKARDVLKEYFSVMDVPSDEDGMIGYAIENLTARRVELNRFMEIYQRGQYPGKNIVGKGITVIDEILLHKKDGTAFLKAVVSKTDELLENSDDMTDVDAFFKNQKNIYDSAREFLTDKQSEKAYFEKEERVTQTLENMQTILQMERPYRRIAELPNDMQTVEEVYRILLDQKRKEVAAAIQSASDEIVSLAKSEQREIVADAERAFGMKQEDCNRCNSLTGLDAMFAQIANLKQQYAKRLMTLSGTPDKKIRTVSKEKLCVSANLNSEEEIEKYTSDIRQKLLALLQDGDTVQII